MKYSPSTGGFYCAEIHGSAMPADAVDVSDKRYSALLAGQSEGAQIVPGTNGRPSLRWPRIEERREMLRAQINGEAARRIEQVSPTWRQLNDWREPSEAGKARFAQIDAIRDASNRIAKTMEELSASELAAFEVSTSSLWPETPVGEMD